MPTFQEPDSDARVTPMRESTREPKVSVIQPRRVHRPTPLQAFALLRRLLGLVAAIFCLYSTISSGYYSVRVLLGASNSSQVYMPYTASYISRYLSNTTIEESLLVVDLLDNDSVPRNFSIYLDSPSSISVQGCTGASAAIEWLYSNAFVRSNLDNIIAETSYNLTFFSRAELIAPVVDCSFTPIVMGDATASRVYYVMRDKFDQTKVFLVMVSLSTQDFRLPHQHTLGPAALVVVSVIDDLRTEAQHHILMALGYPFQGPNYQVYSFVEVTKEGFVTLDSVPVDPATDRKKRVLTANRSGFFLDSEQSQSNIKNLHWTMLTNPLAALTTWQWVGTTMLRNSWGWVRYVNFFFSLETAFNLLVLLLVIYRNFQKGKIWIGDAFISFSDTLLRRGAIILVLWILEGFWSLTSFTLREGNILGKSIGLFYFRQIIHGDLLTIYISLAGLLGHVLRERINPALAVALFEFGFQYRHAILKALPGFVPTLVANANADYMRGIAPLPQELEGFSPYQFKSIHELYRDPRAIMTALFPVFSTFLVILIYTPVMKLIRWTYARQQRRYHGMDMDHRGTVTAFELASGAALQNRVGLVCNYDSCVYIKGLKFASPDGIYCNGFVIANGKWLIRTGDLMAILFMVVTRVRFYDVYAYEVSDYTVNQTAVLVYPSTMTLRELLQLNTTLLA